MTNVDLMTMSPADLLEYRGACDKQIAAILDSVAVPLAGARLELALVDAAIQDRFAPDLDAIYKGLGKLAGTAKINFADGTIGKADRSKTVKWDQAKLRLHLSADYSMFKDLIDITFNVSETKFKALPDALPAKANLLDARTVKYGETKVTLAPPKVAK